jgi:hypothetical protein
MPPPLFALSGEPWTFPPDCGVKCRQPPSVVEAAGPAEFPGRATLDAPGDVPDGRFIPPSRCAVFESENRRHPEPSEAAGLPVRSLLKLAPLSAGCAPEGLLPAGVRNPGEGLAVDEVWLGPLENDGLFPAPLLCIDCRICYTCRSNEGGAAAGRVFEKKRICSPPGVGWKPPPDGCSPITPPRRNREDTRNHAPARNLWPSTPTGRGVRCQTDRSER